MSDDDPSGRVITFPGGDKPYAAPRIPRYADSAEEQEEREVAPEIPAVPDFPDPASFLRSEGIPARTATADEYAESEEEGEYEDSGEYYERRSLAEVVSDWLQFHVDRVRENREEHAPIREAQVADKVSRLNAQTEREMSLMAQHNELQKAHVDARTALVSARGKGAAIGSGSDSGKGLGKGSQRGPGGPTNRGPGGSGGGGGPTSRGPGGPGGGSGPTSRPPGGAGGGSTNRSTGGSRDQSRPNGGSQRTGDRDRNSDGTRKGPGGSSGGSSGPGRSQASGGGNGRQSGSGGGRGGGGGSAADRSGAGPATSSRAERTRAREQRRSTRQDADLADRTADRAQGRANRQRVVDDKRDQRNARREQKAAERKARQDAEKDGGTPQTLVGLVAQELKRRRDRADGKDGGDKAPVKPDEPEVKPDDPAVKADDAGVKPDEPEVKPDDPAVKADNAGVKPDDASLKPDDPSLKVDDPSLKVDLTKGSKDKEIPEEAAAASAGPDVAPETVPTPEPEPRPEDTAKAEEATAPGDTTGNEWISFLKDLHDKTGQPPPGQQDPDPDPDPEPEPMPAYEWRPGQQGAAEDEDDNIPDAEIVEDDDEPVKAPAAPKPEPGPEPSGEARPAARTRARTVGRQRTARQHRTEVTFGEYLTAMANIAVNASTDYLMVQEAIAQLRALARVLREMSSDLVGSHNIDRKVTNLIADLADFAATTSREADRLAQVCEKASTVAVLAAESVAKVYGEDLDAMDEGGLDEASAAVHHN
ncbi:hypothetical protein [Kitasatospora sp. NPDC127060]|uniref:hypothetical protein n=1 Tax=Kitasatospora sp. NPDC127060 TaxID=3347121 RepID=UPI0036544832